VTVVGASVIVTGAEDCARAIEALETQQNQIAGTTTRIIRFIGV
jgi:hypothetical protein